ncbi:hypothetical protein KIW84_072516 [Lathyrus oleraceus]|uniref:Uncharacterized protein n=1 Tax=Pisum sativum TaxID=3888 RepID=A0A9D4VNQ0_PEA|nr:hypothetical protein KIW84_072516 [Pisum sativum]
MGGIFYHILHNFLPYSRNSKRDKKVDGDWRQKLATRANQFMVAACVRYTEARKKVFSEISSTVNEYVDSSHGVKPPGNEILVFIDLINDVLAAHTPAGACISVEASATSIDAGLVKSFTRTLQILDLDHIDSFKVATDMSSQANHGSRQAGQVGPYTSQTYGGFEAVTDDMEHNQDLNGNFPPANEDDYMHENSEDARDVENGMENVGLQLEIQPHGQENLDEDDERRSGS